MNPAYIYLFKINNKNTKKIYSDVFIVNFEHILHFFLRFLLLTLIRKCWLESNAVLCMNNFLLTITCTNLTTETLIQGVKYAQRQQ